MNFKGLRTSSGGLLLLVFLLTAAGCAGLVPGGESLPYYREMTPLPSSPTCRVAVLPFQNDSEYSYGGEIVSRVFREQLQRQGDYLMVQDGDILSVYRQLHLMPGKELALEHMRIIADRMNAQLLVTGLILEMRQDRGEHNTVNPTIIMELQIRDGRSGEILSTVFHRRQGLDYKKAMHFGTIHTVTALSGRMAEEIINLLFEKGLAQCNASSQF